MYRQLGGPHPVPPCVRYVSQDPLFERWPPPEFSFVVEQSLLERTIGGAEVHTGQLTQLLRIGCMRNVQLQVMPTARNEHPCLGGSFTTTWPGFLARVAN